VELWNQLLEDFWVEVISVIRQFVELSDNDLVDGSDSQFLHFIVHSEFKYVIQEFRMNDEMKKLTVRAVNQVIIG
jgi:hypothetical protein